MIDRDKLSVLIEYVESKLADRPDMEIVEVPIRMFLEARSEYECNEHYMHFLSKPKPPVKKSGLGIIGRGYEYDHHAPEYLKKLEEWEKRGTPEICDSRKLMLHTSVGLVEIVPKMGEE